MSNKDKFFQHGLLIDSIIFLDSVICHEDNPPESLLEELIESLPEDINDDLYTSLPELAAWIEDEGYDVGKIAQALSDANRSGILVKGAVILRSYSKNGQFRTHGWGLQKLKWFHAETIEAAEKKVIKWAERVHDEAKIKAMAAQ